MGVIQEINFRVKGKGRGNVSLPIMRLLSHPHSLFHVSFSLFLNLGVPTRRAVFGEGRGPVHLSRVGCTSEDMNLLNCTINKSAVIGCDHSEDAGVICSGRYNAMIVYILL